MSRQLTESDRAVPAQLLALKLSQKGNCRPAQKASVFDLPRTGPHAVSELGGPRRRWLCGEACELLHLPIEFT
jgi:hypothetical protein